MNNINKEYMEAINKELEKKEFIELVRKELIKLTKNIKEKDFNDGLIDEIVDNLKFDFDSDKKYKDICNVLRYRILNAHLQVFKNDLRDFDKYSKVINEMEKYLDNNSILYKKNNENFIINGKEYETDTANSFQTIFGKAMKKYIKEIYTGYTNNFNLIDYNKNFNKNFCVYRDYNMLIYLQNYKGNSNNKFDKVLEKLNELANKYHSIKNIILVPKGFNNYRGNKLDDDYFKSMEYLLSSNNKKYKYKEEDLLKITRYNKEKYKLLKNDTLEEKIDNMLSFINN